MIRAVLENDLPQIWELIKLAPEFLYTEWYPEAWRRAIRASQDLTFVWEEARRILGFICAHDIGWPGYLCTLIVAESARAGNVGAELIHQVQRELAARGCAAVLSDPIGMCQTREHAVPNLVLLRRACV
jgi:predicted N-acetyltransferase YhbS